MKVGGFGKIRQGAENPQARVESRIRGRGLGGGGWFKFEVVVAVVDLVRPTTCHRLLWGNGNSQRSKFGRGRGVTG